jgi:hypothetical protein
MKKLAIGLWVTQVAAALTILIAAIVKTESILATGPTLTVVGLLLALATCSIQSQPVLGFAISGPLVCALISYFIAAFRWGPREGHTPTVVILIIYVTLIAPLALIAWRHIWRWSPIARNLAAPAFQFRLKTLLIAITMACLLTAAVKYLAIYAGEERGIFGGFTLIVLVLTGLVVWRSLSYPSTGR